MEAKRSRKHEDGGAVSLPENIIFGVLVRLPVKDLCRFRCVSKVWRALISDPAFVAAQRSHAGRLMVAMFGCWLHYELRVLDMHGNVLRVFQVKHTSSAVLAPTRLDLICVDRSWQNAMIVDPAARRAFTVGGRCAHVDDDIWWSDFSFGRAAPSGVYKLLRISEIRRRVCEVATITDDGGEPTWRRMSTPNLFQGGLSSSSIHKATVNGVLYFVVPRDIHETTPGSGCWNYRVAAFDLENEVWMDTINGPPLQLEEEQGEGWSFALAELKETLCVVHIVECVVTVCSFRLCAKVWRLIDHNNNGVWVKEHTIRLPAECSYTQPLLDALVDGKLFFLNRIGSRFVLQLFDPRTKAFTDIMEMADGFSGGMAFYTGSLLSS